MSIRWFTPPRRRVAGEVGIIFSAPMVLALLDGTKTQTRRVISRGNVFVDNSVCRAPDVWARMLETVDQWRVDRDPTGAAYLYVPLVSRRHKDWIATHRIVPRLASGDVLWVRESCILDSSGQVRYRADHARPALARTTPRYIPPPGARWRSPIHMPRTASRLTLPLSSVRAQRLQDITEDDARAEGVASRDAYAELWSEIHGADSWDQNPWLWAYTFTVNSKEAQSCESTTAR